MRDAALREKLPTLQTLNDPEYFPYRFGHAFWAYVAGRWGDRAVAQILHAAAGPSSGPPRQYAGGDAISIIEQILGIDDAELSAQWQASVLSTMLRPLGDREPHMLETVRPGVFAAGDVRSGASQRVAGAVGDGALAVRFAHQVLAD